VSPRAEPIDCPFCHSRHMPRFLCDPAANLLKAMAERAAEMNVPVQDFADSPVEQSVDVIMRQVTVKAGTIPVGDIHHPCVIITGRDQHSRPLPQWTYVADVQGLEKVRDLFVSRVNLAIDTATRLHLQQQEQRSPA
jgi:hypothetical protein